MYVTRSQTEDSKLDYTAYSTQQATGTQHLAQQTNYLSESDFGSHVSAAAPTSAKEEPTLFSVTSQPPQQSPLASTPTDNEQQQQPSQQDQNPQQDGQQPTLADYNQSTSKGHEILSQVR